MPFWVITLTSFQNKYLITIQKKIRLLPSQLLAINFQKTHFMKKTSIAFITFMFALSLSSCFEYKSQNVVSNDDTTTAEAPKKEEAKKIVLAATALATPKDLVCDMNVAKSIEDTTTYDGKLYAFCSTECKDEFLKNPKVYISKAGK